MFATEEEYRSSPYLRIGKHVHVRSPGISSIPGYVRMTDPDGGQENGDIISKLTDKINANAHLYRIGHLQELRKGLKNKRRIPSHKIFNPREIHSNYAFHHGGRAELQFNIGIEIIDRITYIRHGIAFSLELSRSLQSIDILEPKVVRFNEFVRIHPDFFGDFRMWHYDEKDIRSSDYMPAPISPELVRPGVFIFFGDKCPLNNVSIDQILLDFDQLLPIYEYVESQEAFPIVENTSTTFNFKPGCVVRKKSAAVNLPARQIDAQLRHNELQGVLHRLLVDNHGAENVSAEQPTRYGMRIDIALKRGEEYWFFEIKTALSARACIREALPQLLEYAYWPGAQEASRLIVVGEPPLEPEAEMYLKQLRNRFGLPIDYQQLDLIRGVLTGTILSPAGA